MIIFVRVMPSKFVHRLKATYTCPWAKAPRPMSITTRSKVFPWALWMVTAHARRIGYCVKVPVARVEIFFVFRSYWYSKSSHAFGVTSTIFPSSRRTSTLSSSPLTLLKPFTIPRVPFTQRPNLSLLTSMTCAPGFRVRCSSAGSDDLSKRPLILPVRVKARSGRASSISRLRSVARSFVLVSVMKNPSDGPPAPGRWFVLSRSISASVHVRFRIPFRSSMKSCSVWRYTFSSSIYSIEKVRSLNTRAEKKYGDSYRWLNISLSADATTGGNW